MKKHLLVDCNSVVYRRGMTHLPGIGRTTLDLLLALQSLDELPFDITMHTQTIRGTLPDDPLSFKHQNLPLPSGAISDWAIKQFPLLDIACPHDLLHIPHNYSPVHDPSKVVVTIHDALFFSYPEQFLGHDFARKHYPELARSCRGIITCSSNSKDDIVHYMGVAPEKISVAPWGVNRNIFYSTEKAASIKGVGVVLGTERPFYVSVSCDIGRKNTLAVLQAYRLALQSNIEHNLVLVWGAPPAEYLLEFAQEINAGRIRFLAHVNDTVLRQLYSASTLSWFPSKYEGFGLPVLESMACGTPVVTCRNSSLSEVGGEAAVYVEPDDVNTMADLMITFDRGFSGYDDLVDRSLAHASSFTWERTAGAYIDFYLRNM
ncbi:MAG: glycosyltransferase family 4 protein [Chlorobiaceae bacterium]|nr:glycosyltransferase family 4 protein [Chlorobiaceae bacterium]